MAGSSERFITEGEEKVAHLERSPGGGSYSVLPPINFVPPSTSIPHQKACYDVQKQGQNTQSVEDVSQFYASDSIQPAIVTVSVPVAKKKTFYTDYEQPEAKPYTWRIILSVTSVTVMCFFGWIIVTSMMGGNSQDDNTIQAIGAEAYRKAAEQGDVGAQYELWQYYAHGDGVPQIYTEAVKWFRVAAEQGYDEAQYELGRCYDIGGDGVPQNNAEAMMWYRRAAEQGNTRAKVEYDQQRNINRQRNIK